MTFRTTHAPKAALVGRTVFASLAVLAFTCSTTAATFAQTVPSPAAPLSHIANNPFTVDPATVDSATVDSTTGTADGQSTVAQTPNGPPPPQGPGGRVAPQTFGHLPVIDVVADFTQPGVNFIKSQYHAFQPLDVGGTVRIPITKNIYAAFDRLIGGTLDQAVERVINTNKVVEYGVTAAAKGATYPAYSRDIVLQYRLDELIAKGFTLEEGLYFRHRAYANDGSGVSGTPFACSANGTHTSGCTTASTEAHMAYATLTYTTPKLQPIFNSTFSFFIQGEAQNVDHHVGTVCNATQVADGYFGCTIAEQVGYIDENPTQNRVYESTQGVTWTIPLNPGASISARERWGALNWYENQPFPFRWSTALDLAVNKRFSPGFTLTLRHSDYHTVQMGTIGVDGSAPFSTYLSPNAIHVASWDVLGTFHIDTNSWFH